MVDFSKIEGFIFDNDGVVVNSEPLSCQALHKLFQDQFDVDIGNDFSAVIGSSDEYTMNYYMDRFQIQSPQNLDRLIQLKSEIYFDLATGSLQPFEGFYDLMDYLKNYYDLAIASSGNHDKIKFSLEQIEASHYFPIICSATEVERGKPAPDLFEFTAECLGLPVESCVVIEDSIKGIQGAKAAGMMAIGFTSSFSREQLMAAGADLVVDSYDQILKEINSNR